MSTEWTTEQVAEQFRRDIRERFEHERDTYMKRDNEDRDEVKAKFDAKGEPYPDWLLADRTSFFWEIYERTVIKVESNAVQIVLPHGFGLFADFFAMFEGTSVAWSKPSVGATIIDGNAHVTIELILIDYWDDERQAKWLAERAAWKATTADELLRRIRGSRIEFDRDPKLVQHPNDRMYTVECWCDDYFETRLDK